MLFRCFFYEHMCRAMPLPWLAFIAALLPHSLALRDSGIASWRTVPKTRNVPSRACMRMLHAWGERVHMSHYNSGQHTTYPGGHREAPEVQSERAARVS